MENWVEFTSGEFEETLEEAKEELEEKEAEALEKGEGVQEAFYNMEVFDILKLRWTAIKGKAQGSFCIFFLTRAGRIFSNFFFPFGVNFGREPYSS